MPRTPTSLSTTALWLLVALAAGAGCHGTVGSIDTPDLALLERALVEEDLEILASDGAANDYFGWWVSDAGDVNDDGYGDVIVGAYGNDDDGSNSGAAYVYLGSSTGIDVASELKLTASDAGGSDYFGVAAARAGDVNNDGYDDVIVGANREDEGASNSGAAYVFLGSANGIDPATEVKLKASDRQSSDYFGYIVSAAGDVNGDGYDDVVVGAYQDDDAGSNSGSAYVYLGSASGIDNAAETKLVATDGDVDDWYGRVVSDAGDVNGDGYDDVIIGAYGDDDQGSKAGAAYVYLGSASGIDPGTEAKMVPPSPEANAWYGWSVAAAGDIDSDGYDDVVVGAREHDDTGAVFVYLGSGGGVDQASVVQINAVGVANGNHFGHSVSGAGDLDGDGYGDIIISSWGDSEAGAGAGCFYTYNGSASGVDTDTELKFLASDGQAEDRFSYCVSGAGDVDDNGADDLIVGAYQHDELASNAGSVYVFGACVEVTWYADADGDGHGAVLDTMEACEAPAGYVADATDCDDGDPAVYPGAPGEIACDGVDQDCDGASELQVPSEHASIQAAIDSTSDGDDVCVSAGTYYENIDFNGKNIRVKGVDGRDSTLIDAGGVDRAVAIHTGETSTATLEGFTLTNGNASRGGGLWIWSASPTITDLVVEGNSSTGNGGGISVEESSADISNVRILDNEGASGGGLYVQLSGSPTLFDVLLDGNTAAGGDGGGIYVDSNATALAIQNLVCTDNTVTNYGVGGCLHADSGDISVVNAVMSGNEAGYGGGFHVDGSTTVATFDNLVCTGNTITNNGAGGLVGTDASLVLSNSILSGNTSTGSYGGGLYTYYSGAVELWNVTLVGNEAVAGGGMRTYYSDSVELHNVSVSGNTADYGGGIRDAGSGSFGVEYTNCWNNTPDDYDGIADPTGIDGNLSVDPVFLDASAVDARDWDLHLWTTSTLIDAGDPTVLDPDGSASDIGAYGGPGAGSFDLDGDDYAEWWHPGYYDFDNDPASDWDCDDGDATVHADAGCACDDLDGDGQDDAACGGADCDDSDADIYRGATEVCDGVDNDCDGTVDGADAVDASTWYQDADGDSYGDAAVTTEACDQPSGYVADDTDCDDADGTTYPGAAELCDGVDNDCDGAAGVEEADADGDGQMECDGDCDDANATVYLGAPELCDGLDNSCDGIGVVFSDDFENGAAFEWSDARVDDTDPGGNFSSFSGRFGKNEFQQLDLADVPAGSYELSLVFYRIDTWDNEAFTVTVNGVAEFDHNFNIEDHGNYTPEEGTYILDYLGFAGPRMDARYELTLPFEHAGGPLSIEFTHGLDQVYTDESMGLDDVVVRQLGDIDEGLDFDADADGYNSLLSCNSPVDCDDTDADAHPGADEYCDGHDDDCDGDVDEDDAVDVATWYADADADGFGDAAATDIDCDQPAGYVADATDCDDADAAQYPGADELCNGEDDDCDGTIDDDAIDQCTWYADVDGDGYGDAAVAQNACDQPAGYVADDTDCDDYDADAHPGADEYCDGHDDDCDGDVDEDDAIDVSYWYRDADADGYGAPGDHTEACDPPTGYVRNWFDCDDTDATINPDGVEVCDGRDNDCDEYWDEDDAIDVLTWYADADADGFGDPLTTDIDCDQPSGYVADGTDCDDTDDTVYPGAPELCDDLDNDCGGAGVVFSDDFENGAAFEWSDARVDTTDPGGNFSNFSGRFGDSEFQQLELTDVPAGSYELSLTFYRIDSWDGESFTITVNGVDEFDHTFYSWDHGSYEPEEGTYTLGHLGFDGGFWDCRYALTILFEHAGGPLTVEFSNGLNQGVDDESLGIDDVVVREIWDVDEGLDFDDDNDGYNSLLSCNDPVDCDDADADTYPGADEYCDGHDDDCDGDVDEDEAVDAGTWYADVDADGFGDAAVTDLDCDQPVGYVADATDCDDADAAQYPGADELCNGEDDDCDADIDEDDALDAAVWYADGDADGFGDATTTHVACDPPAGYVADATDCDDADASQHPGADEVCNGEDDDCLGDVDEDDAIDVLTWYADADGDGFGDVSTTDIDCSQPAGYVADATDCDDADAFQHPGADEVCNGEDDDCLGDVDEDDAIDVVTWYRDADADGYGDAGTTDIDCDQPAGYVADATDCDDADAAQHPGADEVCNGEDDDCLGDVDEDDAIDVNTWYRDADADGFGDASDTDLDCGQPTGYVADATDCDDADASQHPGADEVCNGEDDDCLGDVDEDDAIDVLTWYRDYDLDGYGDPAETDIDCDQPGGFVADATDCDDHDTTINPGVDELCDGVDNDCDGDADEDEAVNASTWYADVDGDGYGDMADSLESCAQPAGYVASGSDCDDADASQHPGADEVCNGEDDDCLGDVDEDDAIDASTWFEDADGDGWGDPGVTDLDCDPPAGFVAIDGDCDDLDPDVNPDAEEICNGIDDDCDPTNHELADPDADGFTLCDGDCDDFEPDVFPGNPELCDGLDNDCDETTDEAIDGDGDTYTVCDDDCDDDDPTSFPGNPEVCDGSDNDCDGDLPLDELDLDGDDQMACAGDCDDTDFWTYDGAPEQCDGFDNDCDGVVDEDVDVDLDLDGYNACQGDCDNHDDTVFPGASEICDGLDNDCDGDLPLDELDEDEDLWLVCDGDCDDLDAYLNHDDADQDGYSTCDDDCDDEDASSYPDAFELCDDGLDNDCDGATDLDDEDCDEVGDDDDDDSAGDDDDSAGDDDDAADDDDVADDDDTSDDVVADDDDTSDDGGDCSCQQDGRTSTASGLFLAGLFAFALFRRR